MTKHLRSILFWGAVWGLFESTAGAVIHALGWPIGFLVWSPAAAYFLWRCWRETGSRTAVILTACVTAAIKLTNLALPIRPDHVINPAVSILLEGAAFAAALTVKSSIGRIAAYGAGWRVMYLLYLLLAPAAWREVSALGSASALAQFMLIENAAAMAVMMLCAAFAQRMQRPARFSAGTMRSSLLAGLCALSIGMQFLL